MNAYGLTSRLILLLSIARVTRCQPTLAEDRGDHQNILLLEMRAMLTELQRQHRASDERLDRIDTKTATIDRLIVPLTGEHFTKVPGTDMLIKRVFKKMTWGDATQYCRNIHPLAHLVVIRSLRDFTALQKYLQETPGDLPSATCTYSEPNWPGFWTAKRRRQFYETSPSTCLATPFIWDTNNSTSGHLPEQSWETSMWYPKEPNCHSEPQSQSKEMCTALGIEKQYKLYDDNCWKPNCLICQLPSI